MRGILFIALLILGIVGSAICGFHKKKQQPKSDHPKIQLSRKHLPYINKDASLNCVPYQGQKICSGDEVQLSRYGSSNGFVNAFLPSTVGDQRVIVSPGAPSTFTIFPWQEPPSNTYNTSLAPWNTLPDWVAKDMDGFGYFHFVLQYDALWVDSDAQLIDGKNTYSTLKITSNQKKDAIPPSSSILIWVNNGLATGGDGYIVNQDGQVLWGGRTKNSQLNWLIFDAPGRPIPFAGCQSQTSWTMRISGSAFDYVFGTYVDESSAIDSMQLNDIVLNEVTVTNHDIYSQYITDEISGSFVNMFSSNLKTTQRVNGKFHIGLPIPSIAFDGFSLTHREGQEVMIGDKSFVVTKTSHRASLRVRVPGRSNMKAQLMVTKMKFEFPVTVTIERQLPYNVKAMYNITGTVHSEMASNTRACVGEPFPLGGTPPNSSTLCGYIAGQHLYEPL